MTRPIASQGLPRPGLLFGPYPQRPVRRARLWQDLADRCGDALVKALLPVNRRQPRAPDFGAELAQALHGAHALAGDTTQAQVHEVQLALQREGWHHPASAARAHALVAQALHACWGQQPYPTQHQAAWAMLGPEGADQLVEMDTGEGKSMAIVLAAATAALAGVPVHVITANDYLAARDAERAAPVLARLGLRCRAIRPEAEADERRATYACDVVYATAREIGFDYLRDHLEGAPREHGEAPGSRAVLRGLCLALIDEADSVLIDHARTPLVMAQREAARGERTLHEALYGLSGSLRPGIEFQLDAPHRQVDFSPALLARLPTLMAGLPLPAADPRLAIDGLRQALVARHLLRRDEHYLVQAGEHGLHEIMLIDETTGRKLPGTMWTRGLAGLVAVKEGLPAPATQRTVSQITLQRLFSRYWKLGGISGTLREARLELYTTYRLRVHRVAPRLPSQRRHLGLRVLANRHAQGQALVRRVQDCHAQGQPVLIGTASVAESEAVAAQLARAGLHPTVLNARDDAAEAALIARAGLPCALTVTTNLAGRGSDIPVSAEALQAGGLHVIACSLNASPRIDRQLYGRTARNGQVGSTEALVSLEAAIFARTFPDWLRAALPILAARGGLLPPVGGRLLTAAAQTLDAWRDTALRRQVIAQDRRAQALLSFARGIG